MYEVSMLLLPFLLCSSGLPAKIIQEMEDCRSPHTKTSRRVENRASSRALFAKSENAESKKMCFYCGEMMVFNMVDFWGIKKTARKCVTDFVSVFAKCHEGCFFCAAFFPFVSSSS